MKKLPNLTAVRCEEVKTQADLDNMARIAAQHGFDMSREKKLLRNINAKYIVAESTRHLSLQLFYSNERGLLNIITLDEFMSYDKEPTITKNEPLKTYERLVIGKCGTKVIVDVYRVLDGFSSGNPILDHISKKSLCAGMRGHKDLMQDLLDIKASIDEAIKLEGQR